MGRNLVTTNPSGATLMAHMKNYMQENVDQLFKIAELEYTIALLETQLARLTDDYQALQGLLHAVQLESQ